ncbi:MAG: family oxidoreductase [Pseudonocardiales bacterium]|nr:family oxidoreductase [Pseudonocardiales bacterium]
MPDPRAGLSYEDKRVVVTGAASGIGAATVELLVGLGAEVHAVDLQETTAAGIAASYQIDLAVDAQIADGVSAIGGTVHGLFNCAGIPGTFEAEQILAVNFIGMRLLTESVVPLMSDGGAICCVGSTSAVSWQQHIPLLAELLETKTADDARAWGRDNLHRGGYPYDFSKEAVNAYVAARGVSLVADGVRLNAVNPGGTRTPLTPEFTKVMKAKEGGLEALRSYPRLLGRLANPVEQAWPMIFLNSDAASFVNGTSLFVDAGLTGGLFADQYDPAVATGFRWKSPSA